MVKAVLFDFFGVLYPDTFWALANKYLPERSDETQQALHDIVRQSDTGIIDQKEFWRKGAELFGENYDALMKELEGFGGVDPAMLAIVKELRESGMKTGIISNVGHGFVRVELGGAIDLFDVFILSADTGFVKPDPQVYTLALERLDLAAEECLFIDDIPRNVRGAEAVGMKAIHYRDFMQFKQELGEVLKSD